MHNGCGPQKWPSDVSLRLGHNKKNKEGTIMRNLWKIMKVLVLLISLITLFFIGYTGTASASEWECTDSNYPINCNNGVCCASSSYCCSMSCCPSGSLCCPTGCCPPGYPWFCPENNRCYERYDDASIKCGSILQECK